MFNYLFIAFQFMYPVFGYCDLEEISFFSQCDN